MNDATTTGQRVLVCGARDFPINALLSVIELRLSQLDRGTVIIHGDSRGADHFASIAATRLGLPVEFFPANWLTLGRRAGPERNRRMLDQKPVLVLAFHDDLPTSKGTRDCVIQAIARGIPVELGRSNGDRLIVTLKAGGEIEERPIPRIACPVCGASMWAKDYDRFLRDVQTTDSAGLVFQHDAGGQCVLLAGDRRIDAFIRQVKALLATAGGA